MPNNSEHWVRTPQAVKILGISRTSLVRRYAHPETGFLKEGIHYKNGMYYNSSKSWEINSCKAALLKQGYVFIDST
tara:strand:- start:432 stop:659 length:228 start_codon:yes stop_codon:yes gene_type:complete